jgi:hypothetical protein
MTPFEDRLETLVRNVEAADHASGWDQSPARLLRVIDGPLGLTYDAMPLHKLDESPRRAVEMIADMYEYEGGEAVRRSQAKLGLADAVAHIFITEMYMRNNDTDEGAWGSAGWTEEKMIEELERRYGTSRFVDIPGSIEGRMAVGVYGDEQSMWVVRRRHEQPQFWPLWPPDIDLQARGAVTDALHRIQAAHAATASS